MSEETIKLALDRIHSNDYNVENKELPLGKKVKDWWIQGLQINRCYRQHWDEIIKICKYHDMELKEYTPILTMNECNILNAFNDLPHKNKYELLTMVQTFPIWCLNYHLKEFQAWFKENEEFLMSNWKTHLEVNEEIKKFIEG